MPDVNDRAPARRGALRPRALLALLLGTAIACGEHRQTVQLAGGVDLLAGNVVQFDSPEPLRVGANAAGGHVCLMTRYPYRRAADSAAIRAPGGALVRPLAIAVRADGGDTLRRLFAQGSDELCFGAAPGTTLRPPYSAIRVVAHANLTLDRVAWQRSAR